MPGILGKKIGMTSIFNAEGDLVPVTVIQAGPCKIVSIRDKEKDGYSSIVLGFEEKKEKNISKPVLGQFKRNNLSPVRTIKEFKGFDASKTKIGDEIKVDLFMEGDIIKVKGKSKGKGFQGVVKRHGFRGVNDATHGQHNRQRKPGSIGAGSDPSRVWKGMRMAGQMGNKRVKTSNLRVIKLFPEKNILLIKGAIPGHNGSMVIIEK